LPLCHNSLDYLTGKKQNVFSQEYFTKYDIYNLIYIDKNEVLNTKGQGNAL